MWFWVPVILQMHKRTISFNPKNDPLSCPDSIRLLLVPVSKHLYAGSERADFEMQQTPRHAGHAVVLCTGVWVYEFNSSIPERRERFDEHSRHPTNACL